MDLTAEFFLQTVDTVFVKHALPKGEMKHRAMPVDLSAIRRVGLLTVKVKTTTFRGSAKPLPRKTSLGDVPLDVEKREAGVAG
jgi:poly(3-hydroxybutyrate) depolymerase